MYALDFGLYLVANAVAVMRCRDLQMPAAYHSSTLSTPSFRIDVADIKCDSAFGYSHFRVESCIMLLTGYMSAISIWWLT